MSTAARHSAPDFSTPHIREARRFYLDLAPPPRQPLTVVCGGVEHLAPDYSVDRATFPYFSIEFVARGKGTLVLAGQTVTLLPGAVFAYAPGVPHQIATDRDDPLVNYFVDFAGRRAAATGRPRAGHEWPSPLARGDPARLRRPD